MTPETPPLFDPIADAYDRWYDSTDGRPIFEEECRCLRLICENACRHWVEIGVGTGRFAERLGVSYGIDISTRMIQKAAERGIQVMVGRAEALPLQKKSLDGVLMALTLCFLDRPEVAFMECARVLKDKGKLVIGTIPAQSPWGLDYMEKGAKGHPVYSRARFHTVPEILHLADTAGFRLRQSCSALLWGPDSGPVTAPKIAAGIISQAGFIGLRFDTHPQGD